MHTSESVGQLSFASSLSTNPDTQQAVTEVCRSARQELGTTADLAVLFISPHHGPDFDQVMADVCDALETDQVVGCTGESIVGVGREVEGEPAVSLWLARLPGVERSLMHLTFERTAAGGSILGWPDELQGQWPEGSALLVLGEPFSFPADLLLEQLNEEQPGVPVAGGMASGGVAPGENLLFFGRKTLAEGAVAVWLHGPLRLRTVVSQGCRLIGQPLVITRAERNLIFELGGRPALARLQEVFNSLSPVDQQRAQQGLHVGRVVSEYQDSFRQGDFLVRNVIGVDAEQGALAMGDFFRTGQTVQFHVRDQQTADEDLQRLLQELKGEPQQAQRGCLLFTCNGRGRRMFSRPHHDAAAIRQTLGPLPLAGFFAQGEIGPVGGQNFLHGFTASLALFEKG